jgi:hypothetical protein
MCEDQNQGGWVWLKIDGAKPDLDTNNGRVASYCMQKSCQTHGSNAQDPHSPRQFTRVDLDNVLG